MLFLRLVEGWRTGDEDLEKAEVGARAGADGDGEVTPATWPEEWQELAARTKQIAIWRIIAAVVQVNRSLLLDEILFI